MRRQKVVLKLQSKQQLATTSGPGEMGLLTNALADGLERSLEGRGVPLDPQPKSDPPRSLQSVVVNDWERYNTIRQRDAIQNEHVL